MTDSEYVLAVEGLTISVQVPSGGRAVVVDNVSFRIKKSGTFGLVGESGSGKTMIGMAVLGLLPAGVRVEHGSILVNGQDIVKMKPRDLRRLRGKSVGLVPQDPMTALDPCFTIRNQLAQPLRQHRRLHGQALKGALVESLEQVQLSAAGERLKQFPHQLSGGMRQRVTSAIGLAGEPRLLIADEPTTALDVTTQAKYLRLLRDLQASTGFALLLVAHDLLLVRHACAEVAVIYAGRIVEQGTVDDVFIAPNHPYTRALVGSIPPPGSTMRLTSIRGNAPSAGEQIVGCRFGPRCDYSHEVCQEKEPPLTPRDAGHDARCWATDAGGWIK